MATDPVLLERLRHVMQMRKVNWAEKRMFGGDCFMVDDKMCFGTYQGGLMVRVGPEGAEQMTRRLGARQMVHGGRPMTGYLMVEPEGYDNEADLEFWIDACLKFNPQAKSSKK